MFSLGLKLQNIKFSEQFAKSIPTCNAFEWELVVDLEGLEGRRISDDRHECKLFQRMHALSE